MRKILILLSALVVVVFLSAVRRHGTSPEKAFPDSSGSKPSAAASPSTLDIIVGGPFAFVQTTSCGTHPSPCLDIWVPAVKGHTTIIGLDDSAQFKPFDKGDYDFTTGLRSSAKTTLVTPVQNASVYPVSATKQKIVAQPKKPFATLVLPTPREIVSWNADPITITTSGSPASNVTPNLATMTILRYDYAEGDVPEVKAGGRTFWKPQPLKSGSERIMVIGFLPQNPAANGDEHMHAREAFKATAAMLGLKLNISFDPPPSGYQRNRPLDSNWPLPQDLLNFIDQGSLETKGANIRGPELFGTINDCKAPPILVGP
jgi:hypothetical protein